MQALRNQGLVRQTTGVIRDIDVMGRELTVFVYGTTQVFDVPIACAILLHGEPVKLRLLLPGDYALITYRRAGEKLVACSIRVNWWFPRTEERKERREARGTALSTRIAGDAEDPHQSREAGARKGAVARNPGILIAGGMGLLLILLKLELEPLGFTVWLAQDSEEALRLYRQHCQDIDLVLLDVQLPSWDGLQTLAALQRLNPDVRSCFLTDSQAKYTKEDLLERGAACVLSKPVRPAEVAHTVQQVLHAADPARALSGFGPTRLVTQAH